MIEATIDDGIGRLLLARPEKRNAMNAEFFAELPEAVESLEIDDRVRVILIEAEGRSFSAGLDLVSMAPALAAGVTPETITRLQSGFLRLALCRKPTIAAIQGHCIGGGLNLAAACDIRVCSHDAVFSLPEVKLGMVADLGALELLAEVLPRAVVAHIALSGATFRAVDAAGFNLVTRVYDSVDELRSGVTTLAALIASNPQPAVLALKEHLLASRQESLPGKLAKVAATNAALIGGKAFQDSFPTFLKARVNLHETS